MCHLQMKTPLSDDDPTSETDPVDDAGAELQDILDVDLLPMDADAEVDETDNTDRNKQSLLSLKV